MNEFRKLYLSRFIYGIGVMSTFTFTLYFLFHGLTQAQIGLLFSVYFLATAFFEVPTGGFADTFGHKASYALGLIIESFYYLIFFLFPSFWGIFIGMIVAALGVSFQSGANESLTYEILHKLGKSDDFVKIESRVSSFGDFAVILAAPLGLFIFKYHPGLPYFISFILVFLAGIIALLVKFEFTSPPPSFNQYFKQVRTGVSLTLKNRRLLALTLISVVTLISSYVMTENLSLPLQVKIGVDVAAIGFVQSLISVGYILVNLIGYKIIKKIGGVTSLTLSVVFAVLSLLCLSQIHVFWGAGFIILFMMFHSFRCSVVSGLKQLELTSAQRSTMASTGNLISNLSAAAIMPLWGFLVDKTGLQTTTTVLALFLFVFGLSATLVYSKLKK
jgi:MFS family permease